jgi:signal transduction histidine kinase
LHYQAGEDPLDMDSDPTLLVRMMDNLFHNALQHGCKPGWMAVSTSREEDGGIIVVANSIDSLQIENPDQVFQVFVTGDRFRSQGGTGLGLAIVRSMVALHREEARAALIDQRLEIGLRLPLSNNNTHR